MIRPSSCLVADESFASWISRKADDMPDALSYTQKIIRKPKGVGTEFKNLANGVTGVMLKLEIQEKKSDMADKDSLLAQHGCFGCVSPTLEAIALLEQTQHSLVQQQMLCWGKETYFYRAL